MVVIEPAEPIGEEKIEKVPQTKPVRDESASSAAATAVEDSLEGEDNTAGYASDGFETASESEVNDDVLEEVKGGDEDREWNKDINKSENGEKDDAAGVIEMDRDKEEGQQQRQVELNEEEINEKALAEANDSKLEGNTFFKDAMYDEALSKYDIALQAVSSIPTSVELRSVCHANRAACYYKLGKFEDTIKECTKSLELNPKYVKVLLRRAEAHEKLENFEGAITDLTKVLEVDPTHDQARRNIVRLKPLADEKREKMKDEMIGKLKDMGNSILGRFGMSVDNFKAVKDPNTGSYSISFQR